MNARRHPTDQGDQMAAQFLPTRYPGIYRRGERYVFSYRDSGHRQRWQSARTLDEARRLKSAREADVARGEFQELSRVTFCDFADDWVDRYQGRGRNGFREETREKYRATSSATRIRISASVFAGGSARSRRAISAASSPGSATRRCIAESCPTLECATSSRRSAHALQLPSRRA